ncbi:hypothetical protein BABINDRAFT_166109 [Babjeviella inositovora NRRL Y-12698]|uniref:Uncharacterized protein n=1 Tax=Babjeviella inositovora NRRL Y-12698 TaxID=984486 RepID=A0A1E3QU76_9ASCO|nr:uncharacterized protein BABINDRAFT_166109 [Babjeviella inositovora NRRL Y-12698]ODQ80487.1 hypothetical protein BABINDRAFT_166109 [Babjeviella inositovora NRRL Y-12698]
MPAFDDARLGSRHSKQKPHVSRMVLVWLGAWALFLLHVTDDTAQESNFQTVANPTLLPYWLLLSWSLSGCYEDAHKRVHISENRRRAEILYQAVTDNWRVDAHVHRIPFVTWCLYHPYDLIGG